MTDGPAFLRICIVLLVTVTSACSDQQSTSPVPVAPGLVAPLQKVFTRISGDVLDGAFRSVPGVRVEVVDGSRPAVSAETDANGRYLLSGSFVGRVTLRATKEGYLAATQTVDLQQVCCPDQRDQSLTAYISFRLESVTPPVRIEPGRYELTLIADSTCSGIPPDLRTRTYAATIQASRDHPNSLYLVDVSGPFLTSFGFGLGVDGNYLAFTIDGPAFFERLPSFTYLEVSGAGGASLETSTSGSIAIPFGGSFEYCVLKSEIGLHSNCYTTPPEQKLAYSQCLSSNDVMILKRQ